MHLRIPPPRTLLRHSLINSEGQVKISSATAPLPSYGQIIGSVHSALHFATTFASDGTRRRQAGIRRRFANFPRATATAEKITKFVVG